MKRGMFIYPSPSLAFSSTSTISYLKSPQAKECLTIIAEMSDRVAKVVQGMLVYSRNDQTPSLVNLNQIADDTLRLVEHKLRSAGINVVDRKSVV